MGIYIKGMEMPNECRDCRMMVYHENTGKTWCSPADAILAEGYKPIPFDDRPDWCPLVEVKESHGRLIDADDFEERVRIAGGFSGEEITEDFEAGILTVLAMLKTQQTVIEAEGAKE